MKKVLSILVALAMLGSMSVMAFAAEDVSGDALAAVIDEVAGDEDVSDADVLEAITDPAEAVEAVSEKVDEVVEEASSVADEILEKVDSDQIKEIVSSFDTGKLEEGFNDILDSIKNMSLDDLYALDTSEAATIVTGIFSTLKDWGVDVDAVYSKLKDSKALNWIAGLYAGVPTVTTTAAPEPETKEEIVQTGSASAIAAFAVMSVAAAAAFVTYKKKA